MTQALKLVTCDAELSAGRVIYVDIRSNFGNEAIYPACDDSVLFAELTGRKTLSRIQLQLIQTLGYNIVVKQKVL